jgi:hypothetical protein
MAPTSLVKIMIVNAFWGKEVRVPLYKGISRNIYHGVPPHTPPKGPAPWGPCVGLCCFALGLAQFLKQADQRLLAVDLGV